MKFQTRALTFEDVLLVPQYSDVLPSEVLLTSRLTRSITLNAPILSAAMDTVTEYRMAIAVASQGEIGIIHKNMSIEAQAEEVDKQNHNVSRLSKSKKAKVASSSTPCISRRTIHSQKQRRLWIITKSRACLLSMPTKHSLGFSQIATFDSKAILAKMWAR